MCYAPKRAQKYTPRRKRQKGRTREGPFSTLSFCIIAELLRTPCLRTSENPIKANFGEFTFHALRRISSKTHATQDVSDDPSAPPCQILEPLRALSTKLLETSEVAQLALLKPL